MTKAGVIFAQAIGEYGALGAMIAGVQHVATGAQIWVENHVTETLIATGVVVVLGVAFFRQRSSRL